MLEVKWQQHSVEPTNIYLLQHRHFDGNTRQQKQQVHIIDCCSRILLVKHSFYSLTNAAYSRVEPVIDQCLRHVTALASQNWQSWGRNFVRHCLQVVAVREVLAVFAVGVLVAVLNRASALHGDRTSASLAFVSWPMASSAYLLPLIAGVAGIFLSVW